jgi:glycosyltransferase involved in cell wall biosynthesis
MFNEPSNRLPRISVIIPTYNRSHLLGQALESALAINYANVEIVVADNVSTDSTRSVVESYLHDDRLRYVRRERNLGMIGNWQRALHDDISGEWFVILSDDDYFIDPSFLTKSAETIFACPTVAVVLAAGTIRYEQFGKETRMRIPYSRITNGATVFLNLDRLVRPVEFLLCGVVFRRDIALQLDAFSDYDNISADSHLYFQSCLRGDVAVIQEPVCVYRYHVSNAIRAIKSNETNCAILRMYFELLQAARSSTRIADQLLISWQTRVITRACISFICEAVRTNGYLDGLRYSRKHLLLQYQISFVSLITKPLALFRIAISGSSKLSVMVRYSRDWLAVHKRHIDK